MIGRDPTPWAIICCFQGWKLKLGMEPGLKPRPSDKGCGHLKGHLNCWAKCSSLPLFSLWGDRSLKSNKFFQGHIQKLECKLSHFQIFPSQHAILLLLVLPALLLVTYTHSADSRQAEERLCVCECVCDQSWNVNSLEKQVRGLTGPTASAWILKFIQHL